jgi:glycosyltransferase
MKVTLITASFNSEETIEETIRSVVSQNYADIEYILIDGKSKDRTLAVAENYKDHIATIISEVDNGLYDALNKGIQRSSGEIIGFLHSDDTLASENVISKVVKLFNSTHSDALYGDLEYVDRRTPSRVVRYWRSGEYKHGLFLKGWMPPHPTFFLRRSCYENYGAFSLALKSSADYELMLRMLHKHRVSVSYLPEVLVHMKTGGLSNASLINRFKANREDKMAWKMNDLQPELLTFLRKPFAKLRQYFFPFSRPR